MLHLLTRLTVMGTFLGVFCGNLQAHSSASSNPSTSPTEALYIFVSFSLPEAALKALYQEAKDKGAILVLRGLQDNSFKKTAETLQRLHIALQIHPELFQQYQVQSVPTFVFVQDQQVHTLVGHVSLGYALETFKNHVKPEIKYDRLKENA